MIVSEEQVRNVLKIQHQLQTENRQASQTPETKGNLTKSFSHAQAIKLVKGSLSNSPEVREEKVTALKNHIAQGKYQPSATHIASKMVNRSLVDSALGQVNIK